MGDFSLIVVINLLNRLKMDTTVLILIGIGLLILALFGTIFWMLVVSGLLAKVEVNTKTKHLSTKPRVIAYKTYTGNYKEVGDAFAWLVKAAPFSDTLGIYYDDPTEVGADKCRYVVGAIVEPTSGESKMTLDDLVKRLEEDEYKFFQLPGRSDPQEVWKSGDVSENYCKEKEYSEDSSVIPMVTCVFPFVNTLSILIAVKRVYPALTQYIKEHKLTARPFMEYCHDGNMHFLVPCADHDRFTVPEFCNEATSKYAADRYKDLCCKNENLLEH